MMAGAAPTQPKPDVSDTSTAGVPLLEEKKYPDSELSALEKSVGRRHNANAPSYADQIKMHPELANAPLAKGIGGTGVAVKFNPLGKQVRQFFAISPLPTPTLFLTLQRASLI